MVFIGQYIIELQDAHKKFDVDDITYEFHGKEPFFDKRDENTGCRKAIFELSTLRNPNSGVLDLSMDEILQGTWKRINFEIYEESLDGSIAFRLDGNDSIYRMKKYTDRHSKALFENSNGHQITI